MQLCVFLHQNTTDTRTVLNYSLVGLTCSCPRGMKAQISGMMNRNPWLFPQLNSEWLLPLYFWTSWEFGTNLPEMQSAVTFPPEQLGLIWLRGKSFSSHFPFNVAMGKFSSLCTAKTRGHALPHFPRFTHPINIFTEAVTLAIGLNRTRSLSKGCRESFASLVAKILTHMDNKYSNMSCDVHSQKVHFSSYN